MKTQIAIRYFGGYKLGSGYPITVHAYFITYDSWMLVIHYYDMNGVPQHTRTDQRTR